MKVNYFPSTFILLLLFTIFPSCSAPKTVDPQISEAAAVIGRVLPEYRDKFELRLIGREDNRDIFEIESEHGKIVIHGSTGIALCSGFNYYLKNICHASWNWRCGSNISLKGDLPADFAKIRKVTPYEYRYIFNYCTFSYSMAFWDWPQWERMIDWMAMNGINMPLAPSGQEIIWQRVYQKLGLSPDDLKDFFTGPAYNAFGRMGCIDGFGGPLPQTWIENEKILQKKILERERRLGMRPVLQGFTGHIPPALVKKNPGLKFTKLTWIDFPATCLLDWEDPLFETISKDFIIEQTREYGTDHLYAIDQFIEMEPARGDTSFLKNMSRRIYSSINEADPDARWVIQTWPFKELNFWSKERTKAYFDGVPDTRMIALELMGESWKYTGWYKHDGWYGKPWVWSVISNFGDNVSMFGGLPEINENLGKASASPEKGKLSGMGMMMEGLDYNPVTYAYVTDLMWEKSLPDLNEWKRNYLLSRYGSLNDTILDGWENIFNFYYTKSSLFAPDPIISRPSLVVNDIMPPREGITGAKHLIAASEKYKDVDAYRYDLVNLFRQIFGQYAGHLTHEIYVSYQKKDIAQFDKKVKDFTTLCLKLEKLMSTREEFLFGKWVSDAEKHATNTDEARLYEWNARAIITTWGGRVLYGYAIKDWAGLYGSYYLPKWGKLFDAMRSEMTGGKKLDIKKFNKEIIAWEDKWVDLHEGNLLSVPEGNSVILAREIWDEYGEGLMKLR